VIAIWPVLAKVLRPAPLTGFPALLVAVLIGMSADGVGGYL